MSIPSMASRPPAYQRGVTLIETITVIAVIIITAGIALPGYGQFLNSNRQTTAINQFSTTLAQARYNAVNRMQRVVLCPSTNKTDCTGGYEWQQGYISFVDNDRDRNRDPSEEILVVTEEQASPLTIRTSIGRQRIIFHTSGASPGSNSTIRFCTENIAGKALVLSNTGRARLARKKPNGDEINCETG